MKSDGFDFIKTYLIDSRARFIKVGTYLPNLSHYNNPTCFPKSFTNTSQVQGPMNSTQEISFSSRTQALIIVVKLETRG